MKFEQVDKRTWKVNGRESNCRTSIKAQVMQNYLRRNKLNPGTWTKLPLPEFKRHHLAIKAIWDQLGL